MMPGAISESPILNQREMEAHGSAKFPSYVHCGELRVCHADGHFLGAALSSRLSLLSLWYSPLMSGICEGFEGSVLGHYKSSCLEVDGPQAS